MLKKFFLQIAKVSRETKNQILKNVNIDFICMIQGLEMSDLSI